MVPVAWLLGFKLWLGGWVGACEEDILQKICIGRQAAKGGRVTIVTVHAVPQRGCVTA